jgi:hypothetical protein
MLYNQDRFFLKLKNAAFRGDIWVDLPITSSTFSMVEFFLLKGYLLSFMKLDFTTVRVFLNPNLKHFNSFMFLKGSFSTSKTRNLSLKQLRFYMQLNKKGLVLGPDGLADLSRSIFYSRRGGVRPIFVN